LPAVADTAADVGPRRSAHYRMFSPPDAFPMPMADEMALEALARLRLFFHLTFHHGALTIA